MRFRKRPTGVLLTSNIIGGMKIASIAQNEENNDNKNYHKMLVAVKIKTEYAGAHEQGHERQADAVLVFQSAKADTCQKINIGRQTDSTQSKQYA